MPKKYDPTTTLQLFDDAHVIWQHDQDGLFEQAIAASSDASGLIVLGQNGNEILIQPDAVPEVIRVLKRLATLSQ